MIVKAEAMLRGFRNFKKCTALVDTGAVMTVIDRKIAEDIGVTYTARRRALTSATWHKLEGEVAIVKEMVIEGEGLDYEKVLIVEFAKEVKEALRKLDVDDSMILGITSVELASFIPDTSTGKLRKIEAFLF
ncbi:MAG: aspartyl protease family protein [Nitrososphaerales archaeon]